MKGWSLDEASSYAIHYEQHVAMKYPSNFLNNTVLADVNWMALYHVADYALSNYRRGGGLHARDGLPWLTQRYLPTLARASFGLVRNLTSKNSCVSRYSLLFNIDPILYIDMKTEKMKHLPCFISRNPLT